MADSRPGAIALGRQMTVEFYDCSAEILADSRRMEKIFLHAASVSGAHVVNSNFHSFEPQGVSGVLVISESHFAVHAWPEHDYAAVDLFTCGSGVDFDLAVQALAAGMRSGQWIISSIVNRGILHDSGQLERLVPVVENGENCGLQLSWKERFEHSQARALSSCIDLYDCKTIDFTAEDQWKKLVEKLVAKLAVSEGTSGSWHYAVNGNDMEFFHSFACGRISGFIVPEKRTVYLNIFTDGFFDPRPLAEAAMEITGGTYYRMQVQVRQ